MALDQAPDGAPSGLPGGADTTFQLIERVRAGDHAALDALFARYAGPLRRWASGRLPRRARDAGDTQDLVQETLLQVFKRIEAFEPRREGALQAYLHQALMNRIRNELRRYHRRGAPAALDSQAVDDSPSPVEQAIGQQAVERYERALARLRPEDREAIVARVEMDCSYEQLARAHFERAVALSGNATDRERLFIRGNHYNATSQYERAAAEYETLLRLFPDDLWAGRNLGPIYQQLGRPTAAAAFWTNLAERWPNSPRASWQVALHAIEAGVDPARTRRLLDRARALAPAGSDEKAWLDLAPAFLAWLDLDPQRAVAELQQAQAARSQSGNAPEAFARRAGQLELALGRVRAAEVLFGVLSGTRDLNLALASLARGDNPGAVRSLQGRAPGARSLSAYTWLLAQAGAPADAERVLSEYLAKSSGAPYMPDIQVYTSRISADLARGRVSNAASLAREFLNNPQLSLGQGGPLSLRAIEAIAEALSADGDHARGATVLEAAARMVRQTFREGMSGFYWLRTQDRLAQVYRRLGRHADADRIDQNLLKLLALADSDFTIARAVSLRARTPAPAGQSGSPGRER